MKRAFYRPGGARQKDSGYDDPHCGDEGDSQEAKPQHINLFGEDGAFFPDEAQKERERIIAEKRQRRNKYIREREKEKEREKKAKRDPFAGLGVIGTSCYIFEDDLVAMQVELGKTLIPWTGNPKIMIDRYDGRALIDEIPPVKPRETRCLSKQEEREEQACDKERYKDMEELLSQGIVGRTYNFYSEIDEYRKHKELIASGAYHHYEHKSDTKQSNETPTSETKETPAEQIEEVPPPPPPPPPSSPPPLSDKERLILERTAKFIGEKGGTEAEIRLRESQQGNPYFAFLEETNANYPLYASLRSIYNANPPKPTTITPTTKAVS